jgi:hypothetical protein
VVLPPGGSYDLEITANLDDSVVIKEELHIMVDEGENLMIPLSAKGGGTTMLCKQDISIIDIGVQLTNCVFEKTIVLENKGRRHQQLKWINRTNVEENHARNSKKVYILLACMNARPYLMRYKRTHTYICISVCLIIHIYICTYACKGWWRAKTGHTPGVHGDSQ